MGPKRGYPIAGVLGGIVSSTNITLSFARASRNEIDAGMPLALGVIGASAAMCLRVLVTTAVLNSSVSLALLRYLIAPFCAAALMAWWGIRKHQGTPAAEIVASNPLQFTSALQMAVLFQAVLFGVRWVQGTWGQPGVFVSAGALGLTDIDALVISMSRDTGAQLSAAVAARAIAIGVVTNTLLKLSIGALTGGGQFRRITIFGLLAVVLACGASLVWFW